MKKLKNRMEQIHLPEKTKQRILTNVKNSAERRSNKPDMRLIAIASTAAVFTIVALTAIVVSTVSNRMDNMIAEPSTSSSKDNENSNVTESSIKTEPDVSEEADNKNSDTEQSQKSTDSELVNSVTESKQESENVSTSVPEAESNIEQSSYNEVSHIESIVSDTSNNEIQQSSQVNIEISDDSKTETSITEQSSNNNRNFHDSRINISVPDEVELTEFAADMYRPDGYNDNIGSALALKLSLADNTDSRYDVIIIVHGSVNNYLDAANKQTKEIISGSDLIEVTINGVVNSNYYYAALNADQINSLAVNGARVKYVGSGEGDVKRINWNTPEGINEFCELMGDMYVFRGEEIIYCPDIIDER